MTVNFLALVCTVVTQDADIGAVWVRGAPGFPVHVFATSCKSIIISKWTVKKSFKKKYKPVSKQIFFQPQEASASLIFSFFFFWKISPELTTANPPFLLRKTGPELTSMPIFLYFVRGLPTTARLLPSGAMFPPGIRSGQPRRTPGHHQNMRT